MSLPLLLACGGIVFFGSLAVILSFQMDRMKKQLAQKEASAKKRVYELSVLKSLQERIGYSLDTGQIIDTLTESLKDLFPYSTVSSIVLHEDSYVFKIALEERVSTDFIEQVKKSMYTSLASLIDHPLPQQFDAHKSGVAVDEGNTRPLASFSHIPLTMDGKAVGLISICSTNRGLYKHEDVAILHQIAGSASSALSKLRHVIATEQEKMLSMIASLADGILMIDNSYQLTLINQAAKNLLGIPHLASPTIFEAVNMLSKHYDFGERIKESLQHGKIFEEKELQLGDKTAEVTIAPVFGPSEGVQGTHKRVIGVTLLIHDITLEKSLEQMKDGFTHAVVHELRSPLTAIKTAAELMAQNENLEQSQQKLATIIDEQAKRLLAEITSLLDAAKIEAGNFTVWPAPNDIAKAVSETIDLFAAEAEQKQVKLTSVIDDVLPQALIDTTRIDQVLNNLISNSLKFTPAGGEITVKVSSQFNPHIPHTPTNPGILVSVSDTGVGIASEKQKLLFHKFAQVREKQPQGPTEGTGLGLYIAKGIVEAHGGNIYLHSTPQHGTTIFFTLPVAAEEKKVLSNPKLQQILNRYTPQVIN